MSKAVFTIRNPHYRTAIEASFARQGFMRHLGARLVTVEPGRVVIGLPWAENLSQQRGQFHGGAIGAIADSAGGYAALTLMAPDHEVVTVEYKINFIRGAEGPLLRATGQVIRAGKTLTVVRIDVDGGLADDSTGDGTPVAVLQATMMAVAL